MRKDSFNRLRLDVQVAIVVAMTSSRERWMYFIFILPLISFEVDAVGVWLGAWKDGIVSKHIFLVMFAIALILMLRLIPRSINAAAKAKELEMEKIVLNAQLADSRISTMMSQIRPHFIYNTLGSIEQLCKIDPPKAGELVHNFAKYLRDNFGLGLSSSPKLPRRYFAKLCTSSPAFGGSILQSCSILPRVL